MNYWRDKVTVVTGGSAGLGFTLSQALVAAGARVVLVARDEARLDEAAGLLRQTGGQITAVAADITTDADVQRIMDTALQSYGRLDALFNNAGMSDRGEALRTPLDRYRELWELNFLAAVRCAQAAAPLLIPNRGHLVFIGSLAAKGASRYLGAYPASKFPLAALAQQMRLEQGPQGLHVLLVCPGPIARDDAGRRYQTQAEGLPDSAQQPGGGVKLKGLPAEWLATKILRACQHRHAELIVPGRARWLFALAQIWPSLADWILRRVT
jgi:uncharacterized protein